MAVGRQINADIEKEIDDLSHVPSIFTIIKCLDPNQTYMNIDSDRNKITIELPIEDYENFALIHKEPSLQAALHSMVIVPALIYVFEEIRHTRHDDRYSNYNEQGWYRSLRKVLSSEKFNIDIESEDFNSQNMVALAQRVINEPLHEGLTVLLGIERDNDEGGGN